VVLNDALEKTKASMGSKAYFDYNAENNNCQDFISVFLRSNGMGDANDFAFVKQDTKKLFKGLSGLAKTAYTLTELGERANVLLTGAGANPSKIADKETEDLKERLDKKMAVAKATQSTLYKKAMKAEKEASKAKKAMSGKGAKSSKIIPSTAVEEVQPVIGESRIGSTEPSRLPRAVAIAPAPMAQSVTAEDDKVRKKLRRIHKAIIEIEAIVTNLQKRISRTIRFGGDYARDVEMDRQSIERYQDELRNLRRLERIELDLLTPTEATIEGEGIIKPLPKGFKGSGMVRF
jgi:hypothetical protein